MSMVLDPSALSGMAALDLPTVGVALASAAAGAATQYPRVQALESELSEAKEALETQQSEMQTKMTTLEDRLFQMDQEFEAQTARFQRKYDQQKRQELERMTQKLKQDMEFSFQIKLDQEKSKLLTQQQSKMMKDDNTSKLANLRMKQVTLTESNEQLEKALEDAHAELERLRTASSSGQRSLFNFFGSK